MDSPYKRKKNGARLQQQLSFIEAYTVVVLAFCTTEEIVAMKYVSPSLLVRLVQIVLFMTYRHLSLLTFSKAIGHFLLNNANK